MALLRSKIVVNCRDLKSTSLDELAQQLNKPCSADVWLSSQRNPNGRLALQLPLDQYSDGELDSINDDSSTDALHATSLEKLVSSQESPTDSAFHSEDCSPECSRSGDTAGLFAALNDLPPLSTDELLGSESGFLGEPWINGSFLNGGKRQNCWNTDNWVWGPNLRNVSLVDQVPLTIPVPQIPMKPRLGRRDIDEMSDLSDGYSITSSESSDSSHLESSLHDLAFLLELTDCTVGVGKVARFNCQLMGQSALTVSWFHGKRNVENTGRCRIYRHGTKHSLEIYLTSFADSATVRCVAYTEDAVAESRAELRVRESRLQQKPPEFVFCLEPLEIIRGDDAELSCRVRGHPVPILTFFVDGRKISPMDSGYEIEHIGNEEWLLFIDGNRLLSSCNIRCLATNPLGETACSASVIVLSPNEVACNRLSVDGRLRNLDRKLAYTKEQILSNAEEMLNNATQMSSLERQLSIVDEYLDRIESKFRKTKFTRVDNNPCAPATTTPAHLSVIEVSYPDTSIPTAQSPPSHRTPYPGQLESVADANPSANRQSVSITVLSRQINSEKINVVFKKSFGSEDLNTAYTPETISFTTSAPQQTPEPANVSPSAPPSPPRLTPEPARDSVASREKAKWTSSITIMEDPNNPYSAISLSRRLEDRSKMLDATLADRMTYFPSDVAVEAPTTGYAGRGAYYNGNITYATANDSYRNALTVRSLNDLVQPSKVIHEKVNRTADRLQQLDSRIDILSKELQEIQGCTPDDLKRLESAVILTASEIQSTERSTKQLESLVTRLYVQQDYSPRALASAPAQHPVSGLSLPVIQQSPIVTYSSMTSTPQDFPQDGPSVKSLMSRFQNDKLRVNDNGQQRRLNSIASEDSSDSAITPSPDKDRKPLPVFNKTKFQENVAANRALPRPKIHASLTARSLSREMRDALRISRPQIGAFRSNIMMAENGEYDPERAAKAKELFLAEGGGIQNVPKESGVVYEKAVRPNRFRQDPFVETHEESAPEVREEIHQNDDSGIHEVEMEKPKENGHAHNGHYHSEPEEKSSRSFDDSLDEETEHQDSASEHHERSSAPDNELSEDEPELENTQHEHEHIDNGVHDARVQVRTVEEEEGVHDEHGNHDDKASQEENGEDIPLSQAPDWDLLI